MKKFILALSLILAIQPMISRPANAGIVIGINGNQNLDGASLASHVGTEFHCKTMNVPVPRKIIRTSIILPT